MLDQELKVVKQDLYNRLAQVAAKRICLFRLLKMRVLNKRLDSLNRGIAAGKS